MGQIEISYEFQLADGRCETMTLCLDEERLEYHTAPDPLPEWTALKHHQCDHCPLDPSETAHCPAAVNLVNATALFDSVCSHDTLELRVTTAERVVSQHTTAQRALSSLMGLLIATSGCPYTLFLKPMARFHLPLASEQETITRALGMHLIAQYFRNDEGKTVDRDLAELRQRYELLHEINQHLAARIRMATEQDSSVNAVVLLDMLARVLPFVIEDHLDELKPLFSDYR